MSHLCLSGNPDCSGVIPCATCQEFNQTKVLPKAMSTAGPPFNSDANLASLFIMAYREAVVLGARAIQAHFQKAAEAQARQAAYQRREQEERLLQVQHAARVQIPADAPGEDHSEPSIDEFRAAILDGLEGMPEDKFLEMAKKVANRTLEGWHALSSEERAVLDELFFDAPAPEAQASAASPDLPEGQAVGEQPDLSAGEAGRQEDPMSAEPAKAVVDAIRNGTLPNAKATGVQQIIEAGVPAALREVVATQEQAQSVPLKPDEDKREIASLDPESGDSGSNGVETKQESA